MGHPSWLQRSYGSHYWIWMVHSSWSKMCSRLASIERSNELWDKCSWKSQQLDNCRWSQHACFNTWQPQAQTSWRYKYCWQQMGLLLQAKWNWKCHQALCMSCHTKIHTSRWSFTLQMKPLHWYASFLLFKASSQSLLKGIGKLSNWMLNPHTFTANYLMTRSSIWSHPLTILRRIFIQDKSSGSIVPFMVSNNLAAIGMKFSKQSLKVFRWFALRQIMQSFIVKKMMDQ